MSVYKNKKTRKIKYRESKHSKHYKGRSTKYDNNKHKLRLYANADMSEEEQDEDRMYSNWRQFLLPAIVILPNLLVLKHVMDKSSEIERKIKHERVENKPTTKADSDATKKVVKNEVIDFFQEVVKWQMERYEGGYSSDSLDPGNYYKGELWGTNHGISADFAGRVGLTKEKLQSLTIDEAAEILVNYASDKLNTNPDTTSKDFIVIYSLYTFYYGKERAYVPLVDYFGLQRTRYDAEKVLSEGPLDKSVAEHLKQYFEQLLIKSFINDLNRPMPMYSFGWYRRYVETLKYWRDQGYTSLKPSPEFLEEASSILNQIKEKQILAKKGRKEQQTQQEQQKTQENLEAQEMSLKEQELQESQEQQLASINTNVTEDEIKIDAQDVSDEEQPTEQASGLKGKDKKSRKNRYKKFSGDDDYKRT